MNCALLLGVCFSGLARLFLWNTHVQAVFNGILLLRLVTRSQKTAYDGHLQTPAQTKDHPRGLKYRTRQPI